MSNEEIVNLDDTNRLDSTRKELNYSSRSVSLNVENVDCSEPGDADDAVEPSSKIAFHLSLDQQSPSDNSGESRTKRFLESDDAIINQLFSQTIMSTGVTPTDDFDDQFCSSSLHQSHEISNEGADDDDHSQKEVKKTSDNASRLVILNTQQRPSIVIDCFDETPPITPDEPTPYTKGAFYFHTTIEDDDDEDLVEPGTADPDDSLDVDSDLLVQAVQQYGLADNFTTIEESTDDILSPTTDTCHDNLKTEINQDEQKLDSTLVEAAEENSAVPFLVNNCNQLVEPETDLLKSSIIEKLCDSNGICEQLENDNEPVLVDNDSEDEETNIEDNITAKTLSFDEEACIKIVLF